MKLASLVAGLSVLALLLAYGLFAPAASAQPPTPQGQEPVDTCWTLTDVVDAGCDDCEVQEGNVAYNGVDCDQCSFGYSLTVICPEQSQSNNGAAIMNCGRSEFATLNCPGGGIAVSLFMACSSCQASNPW